MEQLSHNYLDQHPDIFMSKHKEPHFLINNEIENIEFQMECVILIIQ